MIRRQKASIQPSPRWAAGTKRGQAVDFYLYLSATIVTLRMLIRRATPLYRWDGRPTTKRLK